jgi:hypothetical protein
MIWIERSEATSRGDGGYLRGVGTCSLAAVVAGRVRGASIDDPVT